MIVAIVVSLLIGSAFGFWFAAAVRANDDDDWGKPA